MDLVVLQDLEELEGIRPAAPESDGLRPLCCEHLNSADPATDQVEYSKRVLPPQGE